MTRPSMNRTYDQYLFEKAYKVTQRYPTPIETALAGKKSETNRSVLIGAIVGSVIGGFLIGMAALYLLRYLKQSRVGVDPYNETRNYKEMDDIPEERDLPKEIQGQETLELPNEGRCELWVDPVELSSA